MKNFLPVVTALMAIIGVVVGAGVQHISSKSIEFERRSLEFKFDLYKDFADAQSAYQSAIYAKRINMVVSEAEKKRVDTLLRESVLRIAIFAPKNVAIATVNYLYKDESYTCKELDKDYLIDLEVWHAMRSDAFGGNDNQMISHRDMAMLAHQYKLKK